MENKKEIKKINPKALTVRLTDIEFSDLKRISTFSDCPPSKLLRIIFRLKIVEWKGMKFSEIQEALKNHNHYDKTKKDETL